MSVQLATIVDWEALLDTAIASLVAGVVVTIAASATIYGAAMSAEIISQGRLWVNSESCSQAVR